MRDTLRVTQDERLEAVTLTTNPLHQVIAKRRQIGSTDEDGRIVERVTYDPDGTPHFWGEDTIRPSVTQLAWTGEGASPTGVTVDATTLVVRFSEAIHDATMADLTLTLTPDPGSRTQALDGDGRTLKVTFEQPIPATTPTALHIEGIKDRAGNTIFSFETTFTLTDAQAYAVLADTAAPRVLTVIDTQSGLVLSFDEPVEPPQGTPLHGAVTITRSGLPVDGTNTRLTETALAWTPSDPASWQPGGEYRLTTLTLQDLHSQPNPVQTAPLPLTVTHLATQPADALLAYTAPTDSAPRAASQYGQTALFQGREWHADLGMYYYRARWYKPAIGFIERDPLGYLDSSNPLQAFGSSPFTIIDPLGEYEADLHYGLTFFLALKAGYSRGEAAIVANHNLLTDLSPAMSSVANASKGLWEPVFEYHFPIDEDTGKVVPGSRVAWSRVERAATLAELGTALHVLQDSYGHRNAYRGNLAEQSEAFGFKGRVGLTYARARGIVKNPEQGVTHEVRQSWIDRFGLARAMHATDWTFVEPEVARSCALATFDALIGYRVKTEAITTSQAARIKASWVMFAPAVAEFVVADTVAAKRRWFEVYIPDVVGGMPWEDLSLPAGQ